MKLIAHRGNINGRNIDFENHPDHIELALKLNYDVETDIRFINDKWYLGHDDDLLYSIDFGFIIENENKLWLHAKTIFTLLTLINHQQIYDFKYNVFYHLQDDVTLTSQGYLWTYPGKKLTKKSICVLPETCDYTKEELKGCFGICSDYPINYLNYDKDNNI